GRASWAEDVGPTCHRASQRGLWRFAAHVPGFRGAVGIRVDDRTNGFDCHDFDRARKLLNDFLKARRVGLMRNLGCLLA
ncbi:MAG: hypothetical protein E6848_32080, partial [Bradyrhizobium sp.]|nr:hypothetical protein [Bradyrhizobium sp.]